MDHVILQHLVAEFKKSQGIDLTNDKLAVQRLREAAETAKIELASKVQADIKVPFITPFQTGPKHLQVSLSRAQLEKLVDPLLMKTKGPCEACTKDAGLKNDEINEILLVGGMTRMPIVTEVVRSVFGKDPSNSFEWWSLRHECREDGAGSQSFCCVASLLLGGNGGRRVHG